MRNNVVHLMVEQKRDGEMRGKHSRKFSMIIIDIWLVDIRDMNESILTHIIRSKQSTNFLILLKIVSLITSIRTSIFI